MDSLFPRDSAWKPGKAEIIEHEAPGPSPKVGSTRKLGVVEVPVRDLEEMISDMQYMTSYSDSPDANYEGIRGAFEDYADRLRSYLPG